MKIPPSARVLLALSILAAPLGGCSEKPPEQKATSTPPMTPEQLKEAQKSVEAGKGAMKPAGLPK